MAVKGYWTGNGYMGFVGDGYMLFASDAEYQEYISD